MEKDWPLVPAVFLSFFFIFVHNARTLVTLTYFGEKNKFCFVCGCVTKQDVICLSSFSQVAATSSASLNPNAVVFESSQPGLDGEESANVSCQSPKGMPLPSFFFFFYCAWGVLFLINFIYILEIPL